MGSESLVDGLVLQGLIITLVASTSMRAEDGPISVLCVDDEPGFADLTATFLERFDDQLSAKAITHARDGLDYLTENGVDCIVSDYNMPEMDGLVFLEAVRAEYPDLPFILFTGQGSEEIASDAISAGVTDYVQKQSGTEQYELLAQRVRNAVARHRVREAQERAKIILEASPDAILVSTNGECVYANPAAVDLLAAETEDDILESTITDFVHPDDTEAVADAIEPVQAGDRQVDQIRRTIQTLDGRDIPVEVTGRHITWEGQDGIVTILRDLSEHERHEQEEARYRAAFEKAFDAMVIADDEGRYIEANQSTCDLFGLEKPELLGRTIAEFAPDDFDFEAAWREFEASEQERGTFPLVRPTGERRTVEYAATANIVPGEHLSVLRDVTEREQRIQQIQQQNEQLEEFASIVSHDLRNPLLTAQGYLELAQEDDDPAHFERVGRSLERIERIIDDVLFLAQEGRDIGTTEQVDLQETVNDSWEIVAQETTDATLTYADDALGPVEADYDRLRQLLENVLQNAIEHGGPDVTVRVEATDSGFAIEDDGPGIPEEMHETVFERGYTTREGGTGFGLYIVKQIADAHGWEIDLGTGIEGGTRIEITTVDGG